MICINRDLPVKTIVGRIFSTLCQATSNSVNSWGSHHFAGSSFQCDPYHKLDIGYKRMSESGCPVENKHMSFCLYHNCAAVNFDRSSFFVGSGAVGSGAVARPRHGPMLRQLPASPINSVFRDSCCILPKPITVHRVSLSNLCIEMDLVSHGSCTPQSYQ